MSFLRYASKQTDKKHTHRHTNHYTLLSYQSWSKTSTILCYPSQGRLFAAKVLCSNVFDRRSGLPWLYYTRDSAPHALTNDGITTQFRFPDDRINFAVHVYSLNGTYLGLQNVTNGVLQICKNTQRFLDAAYTFGVTYSQTVRHTLRFMYKSCFQF